METARFLLVVCVSLFASAIAQDRSPHGLDNQKPVAFSPSAYEFFHPNVRQDPCAKSNCSPLPMATQVHETQSGAEKTNVRGVGVGIIAIPAFAVVIMLCLTMGIYYLSTTRQAKLSLTKALAPEV
ncbi:uncharacterized protein LOC141610677 [Silene latifolia]|uniref:uncharacterized protein LOC141610677 n=1 Tax=Silene latifolia TaxID=37657 RepID=UPI003D76D133